MRGVRKYVVAAVAVGLLGLSGLALSSAYADERPPNCTSWDDGTTYGGSCDSGRYRAHAKCSNGEWLYGREVDSRASSYIYCSSVGATYVAGTGSVGPTYVAGMGDIAIAGGG